MFNFVITVAISIALSVLFAFPLMWAVNYLFTPAALHAVFGTDQLTLWQTLLLSFICGMLVKPSVSGKD